MQNEPQNHQHPKKLHSCKSLQITQHWHFSSQRWRERKATIDFDPSSNCKRLALTKLQEVADGVKIPNLETSRSKN